MSYQDRTLTCADCGQQFTWTAGEQEFYAQRGLTNEPRRCPDCRRARKSQQGGGGGGYASGGGYSSGGGGGYSAGGGDERPPRPMYSARCRGGGQGAEGPLPPRGGKAGYCSPCLAAPGAGAGGGG